MSLGQYRNRRDLSDEQHHVFLAELFRDLHEAITCLGLRNAVGDTFFYASAISE